MRSAVLAALAVLTLASPALTSPVLAAGDATYVNSRFGYAIDRPADWVAEAEAENGDGRVFHPRGSAVRAAVWGGYNALDESPAQIADRAAEDCHGAPLAYRVVKPALVAISCRTGGRILYQKTLIRGDVLTSLRFTYPAAEAARWEPVLKRMAASMRAATGN
jgi:hypothetical protein